MASSKTILGVVVVLIIIVAAAALLTQRGGAPGTPTETETETSPSPTETTTTSPETTAPPAAEEKVLRVTFAWPTYIDPAVGSDFSSTTSINALYDPLVYPTPEGDIKPWVAESWEVSDDGLVWTFHIRKGIKFHDGSELTAEDVAFSMQRLLTIGEGYAYLFKPYIDKIEVLDNYTVQFTLKKPFGPFLAALTRFYILNKDLVMAHLVMNDTNFNYGEFGDYGRNWLLTHDAGSGPFMVKEFKLEEKLTMEKFPDYWAGLKPNTPDIAIFIGTTEPSTIRTLMANRELEISDQWQPKEAWEALDSIQGVDIANIYAGTEFYLMIHTKKPPTDDVHCRKAMAYGVDYDTIINQIFPGARKVTGPVPPSVPGAAPNLQGFYYDVNKAKEELQQCKYYGQLDQYPVEFHWIAEVPDEEKVALLFKANMQELGITVNVVKKPWLSVVDEMANQDTSPHIVSIFDSPAYPEAGALLFSRYHSSSANTWEQNEWLLDPQLDKMLEEALSTVDRNERFQKYYEIQQYIMDLAPTIFLFEQVEKHAYQSYYVKWPAAEGKGIPLMGYIIDLRDIEVYPEKRAELLSGQATTSSIELLPIILGLTVGIVLMLEILVANAMVFSRNNTRLLN